MLAFKYALLVSFVAVVAGCGTSFVGSKLSTDGTLTNIKGKHGIPFMLPRPLFKLDIDPDVSDSNKASFKLSVQYVPDPTQTYAIRLDQAALAETSVKLNFFDKMPGVLSSIGTSAKEQVTPTITAIGNFTASIVGLQTTAKLNQASVSSNNLSWVPRDNSPVPPPSTAPLAKLVSDLRERCPGTVGKAIVTDIQRLIPPHHQFPEDSDLISWHATELAMRTLYYYKTRKQQVCLEFIASRLIEDEKTEIMTEQKKYACSPAGGSRPHAPVLMKLDPNALDVRDEELRSVGRRAASDTPDESTFCNAFDKALMESDVPALTGMLQRTVRAIAGAVSDDQRKKLTERRNKLTHAIATAARPTDGRTPAVRFVEFFTLMPRDVWRARHILFLRNMRDICIVESIQDELRGCQARVNVSNLTALNSVFDEQIARISGELLRYRRMQTLTQFLGTVHEKDVQGGKAPAAAEYTTIRAELDILKGSYDAAVDDLAGKNKDAPKLSAPGGTVSYVLPSPGDSDVSLPLAGKPAVAERELSDVPIVPMAFVEDSQRWGWEPAVHPEFVIVVEPHIAGR